VLVNAWRKSTSIQRRDRMLSLLVDDWCSHDWIAHHVLRLIQKRLTESRNFLAVCSSDLRDRVLAYVGDPRQEAANLTQRIVKAAGARGGLEQLTVDRTSDMAFGRSLAFALAKADTEEGGNLLNFIAKQKSRRLRQEFYRSALSPYRFPNILLDLQLGLLDNNSILDYATSDIVERLLSQGGLDNMVVQKLQRVLDELSRLTPDATSSHQSGRLE
jgi:hypothetical protein